MFIFKLGNKKKKLKKREKLAKMYFFEINNLNSVSKKQLKENKFSKPTDIKNVSLKNITRNCIIPLKSRELLFRNFFKLKKGIGLE